MRHISRSTFTGMVDNGKFIMPALLHETYCKQVVQDEAVDDEHPTCEECMDAAIWEEIDKLKEGVPDA